MSSNPEDVDVTLSAQKVMADDLTINVINLKAAVMCFDPRCDLRRAGYEYILKVAS